MKIAIHWSVALLLASVLLAAHAIGADDSPSELRSQRPELEYFKAVNRAAPPKDPELLFLLMAQYANANQHREGIDFLSARLKEFEPRLSATQTALYLGAIGLLRAGYAQHVTLFKRFTWVRETVAMLEDAKRKSGGQVSDHP